MSATQSWLGPVGVTSLAKLGNIGSSREYRLIMIAVSGDHVAPPWLHGKAMLLHQPHDLLVVHDDPVLMQLCRYAPVPVSRKLGANFGNLPGEPSLLDRLPLGVIVVGRPCEFHQPASFGNREATGPAMTDLLALLGKRACRDAPFKNSFSSASLPTSRSSAAIRASYSASMSAAAVSLSSAPASCLAIQMRIRLRLMSYRLASPWRVSPAR